MKKILLLIITALIISSNLIAQTGVIDVEFGNRGIATTAYNTLNMNGHSSTLQADGKTIMASGDGSNAVTLVRYNPNGFIDNSFGTNGKAVIAAPPGSFLGGTASSLAVQADGKIVYAGNASEKIVLARLKTNGTMDSSFGTSGIIYKGISLAGWSSQVWKVILKSDGKIITGGTGSYGTARYYEVAQFLSNGTVDSSFGVNGFFRYGTGQGGGCFSVALLSDDHIAAGGVIHSLIGSMSVINLFPNGGIDSSYGTNGIATCLAYSAYRSLLCRLAVQPDNKVLALGYAQYGNGQGIGIARFKTNGDRDSSFAYQGTLTTTFKDFNDLPQNVTVQADGKLLISGSASGKFAMMRLKSNGTTDTLYARLGKVVTDMPGTGGYIANSFMQPDGKMVLTGITKISGMFNFVAGRFERIPIAYYNTLKGNLFSDDNHNGIRDGAEYLLPNLELSVVKNRFDSLSAFSSDGTFSLEYLDTGSYYSKPILETSCYAAPATHVTTNTTYFNTDSVAFALAPSPCFRDLAVSLTTCQKAVPRPGSLLYYNLEFRNDGSDRAAGHIELIKSNKLDYHSSTVPPDTTIGDTMRWTFTGLLPHKTRNIFILVTVKFPPLVQINDLIYSEAHIVSDTFEQNLETNTSFIRQNVLSSYDPNNKIENHGGYISIGEVVKGDYLTYTVNFQNTGNDTAFNVYIHDTLSNKLDWNTMEMVTASSNYQLVKKNGVCTWSFRNILLPDSNVNEEASHGWLSYRIKPKANVQIGDAINNTAAIYFDYNLPIYTNTVTTTIVANVLPLKLLAFTAKKEGKVNLLDWSTINQINVDRFEVERSASGREFIKIGATKATANNPFTTKYTFTDYLPLTTVNYYRLKMIDKDGKFTFSPVRMVSNNTTSFVSVYPNPAKDNLKIQIESDKKSSVNVLVLSVDGKVLSSNSFTASEGTTLQSINISTLPKGSYFLKVISEIGNKEEHVMKFEKL